MELQETAKSQPVGQENPAIASEILVSKLSVQLRSIILHSRIVPLHTTPDSNWKDYISPIFLLGEKTDQTL